MKQNEQRANARDALELLETLGRDAVLTCTGIRCALHVKESAQLW